MPNDVQISELTKVTETPNSSDLLLIRHGTVDSKIEYKDLKAAITTNTLFVNPNGVVTQASNPYYNKSEVNNLISGLQGQIDTFGNMLNVPSLGNTYTSLIDYVYPLKKGTYFFRADKFTEAPATGGFYYWVVKSHNANDTRCGVMAIPLKSVITNFSIAYLPQNAQSVSWFTIANQNDVNTLNSKTMWAFNTTTTLTAQAEALPENKTVYFGTISSYGHQSEVDIPENVNGYIEVYRWGSTYITIKFVGINSGMSGNIYTRTKGGSTWGDWVKIPTRTEMERIYPKTIDTAITDLNSIQIGTQGYINYDASVSPSGSAIACVTWCTGNENRRGLLAIYTAYGNARAWINAGHKASGETNITWRGWQEISPITNKEELVLLSNVFKVVYKGTVVSASPVQIDQQTAHTIFLVAIGTWTNSRLLAVFPNNSGEPIVRVICAKQNTPEDIYSITANGAWGLTISTTATAAMPLTVIALIKST